MLIVVLFQLLSSCNPFSPETGIAIPKTINYFAYGSNMNSNVLTKLRTITPLSKANAILTNYKLQFNIPGPPLLDPSYASVTPSTSSCDSVHGVCYTLTLPDYAKCLATEGVPLVYVTKEVLLRPYGDPSSLIKAITLVPNPLNPLQLLSTPPSQSYLNVIISGASQNKLRQSYIDQLLAIKPGFALFGGLSDKITNLRGGGGNNDIIYNNVSIAYCPGCGWLHRAQWYATELLLTFNERPVRKNLPALLHSCTLLPSSISGTFVITLNDDVVWHREADDGFPELKELKNRMRDLLDPRVDLGHSELRGGGAVGPFIPSTFRPKPLLTNNHLQTIVGALFRRTPPNFSWDDRICVPTPDGDAFSVDIAYAPTPTPAHNDLIVVMLHGLESNSDSPLVKSMGAQFLSVSKATSVHCVNFRGCDGLPNKTPGAYHLGFFKDLELYLSIINDEHPNSKIFLSGFSLGANAVLKFLGQNNNDVSGSIKNIIGAAVTCVPFDSAMCQPKLDADGFNKIIYSNNFLMTLKKKAREQRDRNILPSSVDFARLEKATTIGEFDDEFIAPIYNFADRWDYYKKTSCGPTLSSITVPFYVINSLDDPFFDPACYVKATSVGSNLMSTNYPPNGGHCGFIFDEVHGDQWQTIELGRFAAHTYENQISS